MPGPSIGEASITIEGDASSLPKDLKSSAAGAMKSVGSALASAVGNTLKAGLATAGAAAGAVLAASIGGGLKRLVGLDEATARIGVVIGKSGDLDAVMQQVNKSVEGTTYSLDAAATAASLMMTSGVDAGKELDDVLGAMVATASAAGAPLDEITGIWQEIAVAGTVGMEQIAQLGSRGVNALDAIAKAFGVTQAEAKAMVESGEVSFEDFNKAMTSGLGEMSKAMGSTFTGMFGNIKSAFSKAAAQVIGPFFDGIKSIMPEILDLSRGMRDAIGGAMEKVAPRIESAFEKIGSVLEGLDISNLSGMFDGLGSSISGISDLLIPLAGAAAGVFGAMASNLPIIGGMFQGLTGPIGLAAGALVLMFKNSETLREAFGQLFEAIGPIFEGLAPAFSALSGVIGEVAGVLGDVLGTALSAVVPLLVQLAQMLGPFLAQALTMLMPLISSLGETLGTVLASALQMIVPFLIQLAEMLFPMLTQVLTELMPILMELASAILPILNTLFAALAPILQAVVPIIGQIFAAIAPLIVQLAQVLVPVIQSLMPVVTTVFNAANSVFRGGR